MRDFILFCLGLIGLSIGSFLNVVINRLHAGEDLVWTPSHCPHCQHGLGAWDLLPVVSFVWLRGRCRYCRVSISWQYPLVEAVVAGLFLVCANAVLPRDIDAMTVRAGVELAFYLVMLAVLVVVFVYDLKYYLILNVVTYPAILLTIAADLWLFQVPWKNLALGLLLGAGFFFVLVVASRERWMGWGDVKLGVLLGLLTPWPGILTVFVLSYLSGAVVAAIVLLARRKSRTDVLPFGTFLAASAIVVVLLQLYKIDLAYKYLDMFVVIQ